MSWRRREGRGSAAASGLLLGGLLLGCAGPTATPAPPTPVLPPPASLPAGDPATPGAGRSPATPTPPTSSPAAPESPPAAPSDAQLVALLQPLIDRWRTSQDVPGAVLGVRLADGRTAVVASGSTDDEGGRPVEPGHRFRVGSITKTFVALLVMQLVAEGSIELDATVDTYLPDLPWVDRVTVRQLLAHRSGIPDFGTEPGYAQLLLLEPSRRWTADEAIGMVADQPLRFVPGSAMAYSNTNYSIAGLLVEKVAGRPLAELIRTRISRPAGLRATFLEEMEPSSTMAVSGHFDIDRDGQPDNVRDVPYTALVTSGAAAGGLSANAADLLAFGASLFGGELLPSDTLNEMLEGSDGPYRLGIIRTTRAGRTVWGHDGALPGFTAALGHLPDSGTTVVALANQTGVQVQPLVEDALAEVLEP